MRKTWSVYRQGFRFDGPHFSARAADAAALRARAAGHGPVYVEVDSDSARLPRWHALQRAAKRQLKG